MKHIAAYALLVLSGKERPSTSDVEKVLKDAGVKADSDKIEALVKALEGKNFNEFVAEGLATLSNMGTAAPASNSAAPAETKKEEAPKEEEEEEEEADLDMDDLFG